MDINPQNNKLKETQEFWKYWRLRIFFTVWITYMVYYIGRVNIGIAKPFIMEEYGIEPAMFGLIGFCFFIMYAFGQFLNGQMGDKFGARRLVALGLIISSIINIIMGFSFAILWLVFLLWGLNGFFQSMGWGPSVKTVANWYPPDERGKRSGRLSTSYLIVGALSWILAAFIIVTMGLNWRFSFWIAGVIMFIMGIHWYIRSRNAPEEVGLPTIEEECNGKVEMGECRKDDHLGFKYTTKSILTNKTVLFAAFGLFCLNIVRYGITEWLPYLLATEVTSGDYFPLWKTIAFPIGGTIGAIFCTLFSDNLLGNKNMPIM